MTLIVNDRYAGLGNNASHAVFQRISPFLVCIIVGL